MCTAVSLRDIVGVTVKAFLESIVPLQGHLDLDTLLGLCLKMANFRDRRLTLIQKLDEGAQTALVGEQLLFTGALILQEDSNATVQKSQLA